MHLAGTDAVQGRIREKEREDRKKQRRRKAAPDKHQRYIATKQQPMVSSKNTAARITMLRRYHKVIAY